jgi:3'(2'), 5'-bisphosphate nucleotidase
MVQFEREAAIREIIRLCGQQATKMVAQGFQVDQKEPGDFVTSVDRALDRELTTNFSALFPQDRVITEENQASRQLYRHPGPRLWCIDPVDGTHDLIQSQQDYAVMVGLLEEYQPIAGWIYDPVRDVLFFGGRDWGLFQQHGSQVQECLPQPPNLSHRVVIGSRDYANYSTLLATSIPEIDLWARPGSFGLKIMEVILGHAGLLVYFNRRVKLWDTVAPLALAEVAGLACCDLQGRPIRYTTEWIDVETLAHHQPIILGWQHCIDRFLPRLAEAMAKPGAAWAS